MNPPKGKTKVFGIGLNKTGTTTLATCGKILGYRVTGCDRTLLEDVVLNNDLCRVDEVVRKHDLFEDWPWPLIFKELDQRFPNSKFILTTRLEKERWLASLKSHSMRTSPRRHCRKLAYGYNYPHGNEEKHLEFYSTHNNNVREYFRDRNSDFLEVCWEGGQGWKELCDFLGVEQPKVPFPHANRGKDQRAGTKRYLANWILSRV